jgi:hypothetical protein
MALSLVPRGEQSRSLPYTGVKTGVNGSCIRGIITTQEGFSGFVLFTSNIKSSVEPAA